jgi:ABC-type amino acid transport substrate-binding protein
MTSAVAFRFIRALFLGILAGAWGMPSIASDRLERVLADKVLRVCIWPDYYGISFRNPKTQQLAGIDIDNARELARDLGVEARFVDSSFATLIDDIGQDRCDIAMFAIGITAPRRKALAFTQPYLASDIYAITTKANRRVRAWEDIDRPGMVVAVAKGTLHETVMRDKLKAAELSIVDTPQAREQEVRAGRADVFMTDYPFSRRMLDNSDWARLVAPAEAYHVTPYAWAVKPGESRFLARLDAFLGAMKRDGRLMTHARRYGLDPIVVR